MEVWRASEDLNKQVGIKIALVAINYVPLEKYGGNACFDNRRRQQEKYTGEIKAIRNACIYFPLLDRERKGLDNLKLLRQDVST
jgi:hypothetical protein